MNEQQVYTPTIENSKQPIHWQRHFEERAYKLARYVSEKGFEDKELFVTGYSMGQIAGDNVNLIGAFFGKDKINASDLQDSEVRQAKFLGKLSFDISCIYMPEFLKVELEKVRDEIGNLTWDKREDLWKSKEKYLKLIEFFENNQDKKEVKDPYDYAKNAQLVLLDS